LDFLLQISILWLFLHVKKQLIARLVFIWTNYRVLTILAFFGLFSSGLLGLKWIGILIVTLPVYFNNANKNPMPNIGSISLKIHQKHILEFLFPSSISISIGVKTDFCILLVVIEMRGHCGADIGVEGQNSCGGGSFVVH
jgi:hypothetical protein